MWSEKTASVAMLSGEEINLRISLAIKSAAIGV